MRYLITFPDKSHEPFLTAWFDVDNNLQKNVFLLGS